MLLGACHHVVVVILQDKLNFAPSILKWANHWLKWALCLVFADFRTFDAPLAAVVRTLHWVARAHRKVTTSNELARVFMVTVLASNFPL